MHVSDRYLVPWPKLCSKWQPWFLRVLNPSFSIVQCPCRARDLSCVVS